MRISPALFFAALFALDACGGSAGTSPVSVLPTPARAPAGTALVTFAFTFPARAQSSRVRGYVSPTVASLTIAIDAGAPIAINAPAVTGSPRTISQSIAAPIGTDTFTIAEYDATNGTGNLLGRTTGQATVVEDVANVLSFTLDGNLAKIAIEPSGTNPFVEGSTAAGYTLVGNVAQTFIAVPEDADGNIIISPGAIPPISVASAGAAIVEAPQGNNVFTLRAPAPTGNVDITASGTDLDGDPVTATFVVDALAAFYVTNFLSQKITVYDERGTELALPSTAFSGVMNPTGIAYVPQATQGVSGTLAITSAANNAQQYVVEFDQSGVAQSVSASGFPGLVEPELLGYANPGGTPQLAVPDFQSARVDLYDASGTASTVAAGAFAHLFNPVAVAFDPHDQDYYVTNFGSFTIASYTAAGASVTAGVAAGTSTMGVAFDSNNDMLYVAYGGQLPLVNPTADPQNAGVLEFTEALAPVTTSTFSNTRSTAYFVGITFDPYLKQLYVVDAGDNAILAFTESGTAVTLPAGAFANLQDPMAIAIVP